jgi:hypothetical protein
MCTTSPAFRYSKKYYRQKPSFPHVILAITAFLFQTLHASPTFVFTSLAILIHLAANSSFRQYMAKAISPLILAPNGGSLPTSWNLVSSTAQVFTGQTLLSTFIGLVWRYWRFG